MVGWQYFGRNLRTRIFAWYMIGGEISVKILVFILDYFQEKLVTIFFQNFQKKIEGCFGLFLAQV